MSNKKRILAIDPGSRFAGYGLLDFDRYQMQHISHGTIAIPTKYNFAQKLQCLAANLEAIMQQYNPQHVVVEKIFLGKNADSAFKLGQVRGVCMLAAAQNQADVYEYAARKVKKSITGNGGAEKSQVQLLVSQLLKVSANLSYDATDALALAICHAREQQIERALEKGMRP